MKTSHLIVAVTTLLIGTAAIAGPTCTDAPETSWMPQTTMLRKLVDAGYTLEKFKVTKGNCYELYGTDKDGNKVEIYHNPVDGSIVESKVKAKRA
ncbi:PepSY domain-containing protein [Aromatoleum aromaticum]|uniref:PepSY domain-containing protein n=1 Tax=Aromatoleum aromaticum TaxID=551760 RepID=UPI0002F4EC71|nr:PepSY domain-containing protein [Aromatoleum aromaticum]NMG55602.1 PepSY domain-containing protein [Aromatoleum aromaticum]